MLYVYFTKVNTCKVNLLLIFTCLKQQLQNDSSDFFKKARIIHMTGKKKCVHVNLQIPSLYISLTA